MGLSLAFRAASRLLVALLVRNFVLAHALELQEVHLAVLQAEGFDLGMHNAPIAVLLAQLL